MRFISHLLSVILHPVFIPLYGLLLYTNIKHGSTLNLRTLNYIDYFKLALSPVLLFSIVFPLFSLMIMYRSKMITSFRLENQKERIPVLFLSCIYYGITYYFVRSLDIAYFHSFFGLFLSFLTGGILLALISLIVTTRWKISLHGIGIGALAGGFLAFSQEMQPMANFEEVININILLISLVGILATARLILKAHSINQVIVGSLLGIITEYIVVSNHFWI
jgi:hypothetical protein